MRRREYMRVAGGLGGLSMVGLAGCLGDDNGDTGNDEAADDSPLEWLPVPDAIDEELADYNVRSTAPTTFATRSDDILEDTWESYDRWLNWEAAEPNPTAGEVSRVITGSGDAGRGTDEARNIRFSIAEHSLDDDDIASTLTQTGFEEAGSYEGFDLYERDDGAEFRAQDDGILVSGDRDRGGEAVVEALIDSSLGTVDRYHDTVTEVGQITDALETDYYFQFDDYPEITQTEGRQGVFQGSIARGYCNRLAEERIELTHAEVFVEGADIPQSAIEAYQEAAQLFNNGDDLETRIEGNLLLFEWSVGYDEVNTRQLG